MPCPAFRVDQCVLHVFINEAVRNGDFKTKRKERKSCVYGRGRAEQKERERERETERERERETERFTQTDR